MYIENSKRKITIPMHVKIIEIKSSVCFVLFVLSVLCILILAYGLYGQGTGLFASIFSLVRGIRVFVPKTIPYL